MKVETLNYIYNLLTKEVDTTRTLQQHTFKILCEAEQTENDEEIEKANEDHQRRNLVAEWKLDLSFLERYTK